MLSQNFFINLISEYMKTFVFIILALFGIQAGSDSPATLLEKDSAELLESPGSSKMLTDWMNVHLSVIRSSKVPSQHFRQQAYIGVALYESVVAGVPDYLSLSGQLNGYNDHPVVPAGDDFCWQASANAALAATYRFFYPDNPVILQRIDSTEQACNKQLLNLGFSENGVMTAAKYGTQVAQSVIAWSKTDGADQVNAPYVPPKGLGYYELTPPGFTPPVMPYLGNCRTFVAGSIDNTMPPPPALFSTDPASPFYQSAKEVYKISMEQDPEKIATARYWDDFPDGRTLTAGGHWESILKTLMSQLNLSLIEGARAYAGLFIAAQDASIGCFKVKYTYNLIRPVTYIQKYMRKRDWNPLIVTPSHPEYPAAHATVSMSAATMLTQLLGDQIAFTDNTYEYLGYKPRQFNSLVEAGKEAGMSRLYGGIHYLPSIQAGYEQGTKVANNVGTKLKFKRS
jgi:hypothetical protein